MDIAIHLGAHCTDDDLLLKTLARNADALAAEGVVVPSAGRVRPAIRKAMQARGGSLMPGGGQTLVDELLDGVADPDGTRRMVLSYEGFLGTYAKVLAGTTLYADAGRRAETLRGLFPGHSVAFFIAIRNPATFVPALFEASSVETFEAFIAGQDLSRMTWSTPLAAIRDACPEVPLTVWCNEDLPLLWPEILRETADVETPLDGEDAILRDVMTATGFHRLETYLRDNPAPDLSTHRKVMTAFLGKYADEAKIDQEIALPGWSEAMIAGLSALYEADLERIRARDDIAFIQP